MVQKKLKTQKENLKPKKEKEESTKIMTELFKSKKIKELSDIPTLQHSLISKKLFYHEKIINKIRENGDKIDRILIDLRKNDVDKTGLVHSLYFTNIIGFNIPELSEEELVHFQ